VTPRVQQDVRQRIPHLARRAEDMEVEAIREHGAAKTLARVVKLRSSSRSNLTERARAGCSSPSA
jgi:hypothetical protein